MNRDILAGGWERLRGQVKRAWEELTEEDLDKIGGRWDLLASKLQEKYGYSKMEAESEIDSLLRETVSEDQF